LHCACHILPLSEGNSQASQQQSVTAKTEIEIA